MVSGTRQSARLANQPDNEPEQLQEQTSPKGTKRKADTTSPKKSRGGKAAEQKKQKTLEETIDNADAPNDDEMIEAAKAVEGTAKETETKGEGTAENGQNADDVKQEDGTTKEQPKQDDGKSGDHVSDGAVKQDSEREQNMPTNILEKGIIYFFTRGRVGIDNPEGPQDLQRTYFVMRPLPQGAKLGDGRIEDSDTNRLFALPKKTFPKSHSDRYMAFVEKGKTTMQSLKDTFFAGAEHETKTQGTRVQHLHGNDTVFDDLKLSKDEYPKVPTTW